MQSRYTRRKADLPAWVRWQAGPVRRGGPLGAAGCMVAARLSGDPSVSVLLLEAGKADEKKEIHIPAAFSKLFHTEYDWDYRTVPAPKPRGDTEPGANPLVERRPDLGIGRASKRRRSRG